MKAPYPGFILCQDTYFVGSIKGFGKIYNQTVIDAHGSHVFGKLCRSKLPMTAVDTLEDRVLPFYEEHGVEAKHILSDNGRGCCGGMLQYSYELHLEVNQIEHRRTHVSSPETNGFGEQAHQGYRTQGRTPHETFLDAIAVT